MNSKNSKSGAPLIMPIWKKKPESEHITRLSQEISELKPSKETLKIQARLPEVPEIRLDKIDINTGELVDYDTLRPYLERVGYLPALAFKLWERSNDL